MITISLNKEKTIQNFNDGNYHQSENIFYYTLFFTLNEIPDKNFIRNFDNSKFFWIKDEIGGPRIYMTISDNELIIENNNIENYQLFSTQLNDYIQSLNEVIMDDTQTIPEIEIDTENELNKINNFGTL